MERSLRLQYTVPRTKSRTPLSVSPPASSTPPSSCSPSPAIGLLYSHFPSKDALLLALFERGPTGVQPSFVLADAYAVFTQIDLPLDEVVESILIRWTSQSQPKPNLSAATRTSLLPVAGAKPDSRLHGDPQPGLPPPSDGNCSPPVLARFLTKALANPRPTSSPAAVPSSQAELRQSILQPAPLSWRHLHLVSLMLGFSAPISATSTA